MYQTPSAPPVWLKVCVTCDRYAAPAQAAAEHGKALADAIEGALRRSPSALALRRVHCLSGCKHPGNVVLGAADKTKLRLHDLKAADADAVVTLAKVYMDSSDGEPTPAQWPASLEAHLATTVKPQTASAQVRV